METLKLNNTPVRTSRNFGINNIELKDIELPENLKEFKNVEIVNEGCSLEKSVSNKKLVYGKSSILYTTSFFTPSIVSTFIYSIVYPP